MSRAPLTYDGTSRYIMTRSRKLFLIGGYKKLWY